MLTTLPPNKHTIASRLQKFSRDRAPHTIECLLRNGRAFVQTRIASVLAWWWGVELGQHIKFYGVPLFRRMPGSTIRLADNCEFRSSSWSNLIGINRSCLFATHHEDAVIEIGKGCAFSGTVIGAVAGISIGERVMCGANVTISDTDGHAVDWRERAAGVSGKTAPVVIEDDVWLGMNVTVLKGVTIGARTVVSAGSIVDRSLPPGVIAGGQPAIVICKLPNEASTPDRNFSGAKSRND